MRFRVVSASALLFSLVSMTGCSLAWGLVAMPREAVEPLQSAHQIHLEVRAEEQKPAAERRPASWYEERASACETAMGQARAHLLDDDMRPISSRRTPDGLHPAEVQEGCYEVLRRADDARSREKVARIRGYGHLHLLALRHVLVRQAGRGVRGHLLLEGEHARASRGGRGALRPGPAPQDDDAQALRPPRGHRQFASSEWGGDAQALRRLQRGGHAPGPPAQAQTVLRQAGARAVPGAGGPVPSPKSGVLPLHPRPEFRLLREAGLPTLPGVPTPGSGSTRPLLLSHKVHR